jgi:hypothetical protein
MMPSNAVSIWSAEQDNAYRATPSDIFRRMFIADVNLRNDRVSFELTEVCVGQSAIDLVT